MKKKFYKNIFKKVLIRGSRVAAKVGETHD